MLFLCSFSLALVMPSVASSCVLAITLKKFAIRVTVLIHSLRTFKQHSVIFSSPGVWVMLYPVFVK